MLCTVHGVLGCCCDDVMTEEGVQATAYKQEDLSIGIDTCYVTFISRVVQAARKVMAIVDDDLIRMTKNVQGLRISPQDMKALNVS